MQLKVLHQLPRLNLKILYKKQVYWKMLMKILKQIRLLPLKFKLKIKLMKKQKVCLHLIVL
ncbi:unnamed protein product [Meloidogyne enterolobii]|uniref:Uncharacterized protein n=1 Tax=Meloidogyne enterolobii TaxID=390850 RepID=A0ACB0YEH3_MELEN